MSEEPRDLLGLIRGGEGAITGTVVCAAAIAVGTEHGGTIGRLILVIMGTVAVYWVAHLHAVTLGRALTHRHHPLAALRFAFRETLPILGASVVPLAVLLAAFVLGAEVRNAAWIALGATVALLTVYSYVAGARGGMEVRGRVLCALAGAAVGLLVVLLKVGLH
ncbi:hypothetical protein [Cellulomonas rhizosphaerae]|uniref:Uncharacterized protein n=1 Tax=Cellulomonas rhizosphaerae TaxID=2293719 RepID=A0A413RKZ1_9CELL|nr:hypothetical protein [Cellulomonas rhizosphaerae]RHA40085.1 hypothetical protein D1825_10880 [Cellulomonas rhizosphaerae]